MGQEELVNVCSDLEAEEPTEAVGMTIINDL